MIRALRDSVQNRQGKRAFFLTILGGAFAVLGHAPFFFWPAFLLAMAGFYLRLEGLAAREGPIGKSAFWAGWAFGFGYFLASLFWVASAFITRGGGYVLLAPFGTMLLPAGLAFFWAIAAWHYVFLRRVFGPSVWRGIVLFTALFFLAEFLRGTILSGFPWNLPGYIWEAGRPISQSAAWWGIYGLSFLTLLWAACLGALLSARFTALRAAPFLALSVIFTALFLAGQSRLTQAPIIAADAPKIRVISTSLTQSEKYDRSNYVDLINHYLELSFADGAPGISAIIWSEGAVPGLILEDDGLMDAIGALLAQDQLLIMGATRREFDAGAPVDMFGGQYRYYNSLVALMRAPSGAAQVSAAYDKQKLVPFGEYFPANGLISGLNIDALTQAVSSFDRGSGVQPNMPGLPPVSAQICYESIFSGFTQSSGDTSPQWILNISNDSWFGPTTGPKQHFNQVKYRAIEQGLPIVRSAASGLSGFVDPYGRDIVIDSGANPKAVDHRLPKALTPPFFSRLMD